MNDLLGDSSGLWIFILQAFLFSFPFPASFLAYRWARTPQKEELIKRGLRQVGVREEAVSSEIESHRYRLSDYLWPIAAAWLMVVVIYSMTHPYVIRSGIWTGVLEEVVDIFGVDGRQAELAGRFLYWGFMGAWVYSINLILRRFLAYDLTPGVYVFVINRFLLAWLTGAIVGLGIGTFSRGAGMSTSINMTNVFIVVFCIGFFPEWGMNWIMGTAKRLLGEQGGITKETRLSAIEGLSIWHQGRLQQEGIENVQNLAAANIPALVIATPFTVGQIIDWVDQAILWVYANDDRYPVLEAKGIRCASDFLVATESEVRLQELALICKVEPEYLRMLRLSLQSAANINFTAKFRGRHSLDDDRAIDTHDISIFDTASPATLRLLERHRQAMRG